MKSYCKGKENKITIVAQEYVNHGGYFQKLYRVCAMGHIYLRPSLPDMDPGITKSLPEFNLGFYKILTDDLHSKDYLELWNKFPNQQNMGDLIDKNYLNEISCLFENFTGMTLFGLDFLYNSKNKEYSLIDVNFFPGYKEINQFDQVLAKHVKIIQDKIRKGKKINE
jgi:inositol-1,3,4-trisphosphate 5/6-kinase/inositol-tetrakisphosphate 1-kinase